MRALIFITIIAAFALSCNPQPENGGKKTKNGNFTIKEIDGCEYIEFDYGIFDHRVYSLTHKGNCKFCKLRNQTK